MTAGVADHLHHRKRLYRDNRHPSSPSPPPTKKRHSGLDIFRVGTTLSDTFARLNMGNLFSNLFGHRDRRQDEEMGWAGSYAHSPHGAADLTVATLPVGRDARVLTRGCGDASKAVPESLSEVTRGRKVPFYKGELFKANKRNEKLSELQNRVKLEEERLAELRKANEVPPLLVEVYSLSLYIYMQI